MPNNPIIHGDGKSVLASPPSGQTGGFERLSPKFRSSPAQPFSLFLTIPYPPQANHMHTVARGRKIMSSKYRAWVNEGMARLYGSGKVTGPYHMRVSVERPDRRKRDLDNLIKPVGDLMVRAGIVDDDSLCQSIYIEWSARAPRKPAFVQVEVAAA